MLFVYKEIKMEVGYRIDLLVENKEIVEVKSLENLAPVHYAQVLTYLKLPIHAKFAEERQSSQSF